MANYITTVGNLTEEVADLLRHDNLDTRIYTWLSMAYNDMCSRAPSHLFLDLEVGTIAAESVALSIGAQRITDLIALVIRRPSSHILDFPRYLTPIDYERLAHDLRGGALATGTAHTHWTVMQADASTTGKPHLYLFPNPTVSTAYHLFYRTNQLTTTSVTTDYLSKIPYHWEHVVIWGAACYGAKALRPELYPIYKGEYEQALRDFHFILNYRPDSTPVLKSITGPYARSIRALAPPRFPTNITP